MKYIRFFFLLNFIFWVLVIFFSIVIYTDGNPIKFLINNKFYVQSYFPQGWAFFTKNARDASTEVFILKNRKIEKISYQRQGCFENLLGLKRDARSLSGEYAYLIEKINKDSLKWTTSNEFSDTFFKLIPCYTVKNHNKTPFLKDTILITRTIPIAWACSRNKKNIKQSFDVIKLNVKCP